MKKSNLAFLALALAAVASSPAASTSMNSFSGTASYSLTLRGFVPVICRVSVTPSSASAETGVQDLGELKEFCNAPDGYDVFIAHTGEANGAAVIVDGQQIALSDTGETKISTSSTAAFRDRSLQLALNDDSQLTGLTFDVQAH
jgi:hypothetical protein